MAASLVTSLLRTLRFIATHELSSRRPMGAYWRFARWQVMSRLRQDVVFHWIDGAKLVVANGMTGATGNIYCGLHEFEDMCLLLHLLRPGDLFVDVGANVGSYTVLASAVCGARSIALEPDLDAAAALRRNIEVNRIENLVQVIDVAAGASSGRAHFTVGLDTTNRVISSDLPGSHQVPVRSLDELLANENPILIKIDVEGYEPEVISGARSVLRRESLAAVIIETVDDAITAEMNDAGFQPAVYEPFERRLSWRAADRVAGRPNALFVRGDLLEPRVSSAPRRHVAGVSV